MAGIACACLAAGACSSSSLDSNPFAQVSNAFKPDAATLAGRGRASSVVTAEDLIGSDGACAGGATVIPAAAPEAPPAPEAAAPSDGTVGQAPAAAATPENDPLLRPALGLALGMTECEVARRAGTPERVEVGTDDRGERSVTLAYMRGERAGIYRFREGRLFTIERVAVVEEPKKPVKKPAKPAKPAMRQAATPPAQPRSAAPKASSPWPSAPKPQQQPAQAAPWPAPPGQQQQPAQSQVWPSPPPLRSGQPSG